MQNDINIKEFNEVPNFEDIVASVRSRYGKYRTSFPFNRGKILKDAFNKIVNSVYQECLSFNGFDSNFLDFKEFKGLVSTKLNNTKEEATEIKQVEVTISKDVVNEIHWQSFWKHW